MKKKANFIPTASTVHEPIQSHENLVCLPAGGGRVRLAEKLRKYGRIDKLCFIILMFCGFYSSLKAQPICLGVQESDVYNPNQQFSCVDGQNQPEVLLSTLIQGPNAILLSPLAATTTPQYVIIRGILRIDNAIQYTFAPGSEIVILSTTSNTGGITVSAGCGLKLSGVTVHGVSNPLLRGLFRSIQADPNSMLEVENCKINDASIGIHAKQLSTISIVDNIFGMLDINKAWGNFIAIRLGDPNSSIPFPIFFAPGGPPPYPSAGNRVS
jgi:hypothetical protein